MSRTVVGVAGLMVVGIAGGTIWWNTLPAPETPALPTNLAELDSDVAQIVRSAHAAAMAQPRDAAAWAHLGMVCEGNQLFSDAGRSFEHAVMLQSDRAQWWYHLGLSRSETSDIPGALDAFRMVTQLEERYGPAHWRLGLLLLDEADLDGAERHFRRAMMIDPDDEHARLGMARLQLQRDNAEAAADALESIVRLGGTNLQYACQLLAAAHRRLGQHDLADEFARRGRGGEAVWSDPWQRDSRPYARGSAIQLDEAQALISAGKVDRAIAIIREVCQREPESYVAINNLSTAYRAAGDYDRSIEQAERVLAIKPEFAPAHLNLAMAHAMKAEQAPSRDGMTTAATALVHVDRALEINGSYAAAYGLRGRLLRHQRPETASQAYVEAARCEPANALWVREAAEIQIELRHWQLALELLEPLTQQSPEDAQAFSLLAQAYAGLDRPDDAARAQRQAARLRPAHAPLSRQVIERRGEVPPPPPAGSR
jgi:tetratricopeptide (TPR) repeat protein